MKVYALATIGDSSMLHLAGKQRIGMSDRWRWAPFCGAHIRRTSDGARRKLMVVTAQQRPLEDLQCSRCIKIRDAQPPNGRRYIADNFDPTPAETYGGDLPEGKHL